MKEENRALLSKEELGAWRDNTARVGVACVCGTHSSVAWEKGGEEWFEGHVLSFHVDEKKKLLALLLSLPLNPKLTESQIDAITGAVLGIEQKAESVDA